MKYPFTTARVNKNKIVNFLFDCGVDKKPGDKGSKKKRIRDRIDYARNKKRIEVKRGNDGDYLIVAEFFKWAVEIWPELERIENLPLQRNTVVIHGIVQAQEANVALNVHAAVISKDYGELRNQFSKCLKKLHECESENENLINKVQEQHEELVELRAYKQNRSEQARASGRMGKGVKKNYK